MLVDRKPVCGALLLEDQCPTSLDLEVAPRYIPLPDCFVMRGPDNKVYFFHKCGPPESPSYCRLDKGWLRLCFLAPGQITWLHRTHGWSYPLDAIDWLLGDEPGPSVLDDI